MKSLLAFLCALGLLSPVSAWCAPKKATLEDLRKLPINCLVPSWLPKGYHFKEATIDYEDREGLKDEKEGLSRLLYRVQQWEEGPLQHRVGALGNR